MLSLIQSQTLNLELALPKIGMNAIEEQRAQRHHRSGIAFFHDADVGKVEQGVRHFQFERWSGSELVFANRSDSPLGNVELKSISHVLKHRRDLDAGE